MGAKPDDIKSTSTSLIEKPLLADLRFYNSTFYNINFSSSRQFPNKKKMRKEKTQGVSFSNEWNIHDEAFPCKLTNIRINK